MKITVELNEKELQNMRVSEADLQTSIELVLDGMTGPEGEIIELPLFDVQVKVSP